MELDDKLIEFFSTMEINFYDGDLALNLLDMFPLLKSGFSSRHVINCILGLYLTYCCNEEEDKFYIGCYKDFKAPVVWYKISGSDRFGLPISRTLGYIKMTSAKCSEFLLWEEKLAGRLARTLCTEGTNKNRDFYLTMERCTKEKANVLLEGHPKANKLHNAIIKDNIQVVKELLVSNLVSLQSYSLCLRKNNDEITKLVKDNLIKRIFLYNQVFNVYGLVHDLFSRVYRFL